MHLYDLAWAAIGLLALIYPLRRLLPHVERRGIRDVTVILSILGVYPALLAVFHLTPFDLGLVYSVTTLLPVLYFFSMTNYVGIQFPHAQAWRYALFTASAVLAVVALTNVWHGQFAEFEAHVQGQPNHMLDDLTPGIGMGIMHAFSLVFVASAMILSLVQFLRARLRPAQVLLAVVLPCLALWSFTSTERWSLLEKAGVSGFILTTSILLLVANYALMRNHFLEIRVLTRSKLIQLLPDAVLLLSSSGRILDANPALAALVQQPLEKLIDGNIGDHLPQVEASLINQDDGTFELDLSTQGAPLHFQGSVASAETSSSGRQRLIVLRDVTELQLIQSALLERDRELREANTALVELSVTDPLTGLRNRRSFLNSVEHAVALCKRNGRQFAVLAIDIDHFKAVNDQHGHDVGDKALCHIAKVLERECRSTDFLSRYGGEEFVVLLGDLVSEEVEPAAERFRVAVEQDPLQLSTGEYLPITVSIGGAAYDGSMSVEDLLKRADGALYRAKNSGRNRTCVKLTTHA